MHTLLPINIIHSPINSVQILTQLFLKLRRKFFTHVSLNLSNLLPFRFFGKEVVAPVTISIGAEYAGRVLHLRFIIRLSVYEGRKF